MRDHRDLPFEVKEVGDDGSFYGYGSIFGNVDSYKEVVAPGAFTDSLAAWKSKGRLPAMLWQHRSGEPIGVYSDIREDDVGLQVRGKLALKTARGAEAYELLKMGAISGLSIGYQTREDSLDKVTGIRTLKKVELWEVSLVTFPANDASRVTGVKAIEQLGTLAEAEAYLREVGGFSKSQAVALASRIKSIARSESEELARITAAVVRRGMSLSKL